MKVLSRLAQKDRVDLTPGELFWIRANGDALCLYVSKLEDGRDAFISLSDASSESYPSLYRTRLQGWCLSYGVETVLEVVDGEKTRPSNANNYSTVMLDGDALVMRVTTKDGFADEYVNLTTMAINHAIGYHPIPVAKWQIWACEEDIRDDRRAPIFEISEQPAS